MNRELRERLQEITLDLDVASHRAQIEILRTEMPHTVTACDSQASTDDYTCAVHAFGLVEDPTYLDVASFGLR